MPKTTKKISRAALQRKVDEAKKMLQIVRDRNTQHERSVRRILISTVQALTGVEQVTGVGCPEASSVSCGPVITVHGDKNEPTGVATTLLADFKAPIRPDVANSIHPQVSKNSRQGLERGLSEEAGHQTSVESCVRGGDTRLAPSSTSVVADECSPPPNPGASGTDASTSNGNDTPSSLDSTIVLLWCNQRVKEFRRIQKSSPIH